MMNIGISLDDRVGEIADTVAHAARVFEIVGVDYCCGRQQSLRDAAASAGLQTGEMIELLQRTSPSPGSPPIASPTKATLTELTRFVVNHHHRRARHMLVNLTLLAAEVASAHAASSEHLESLHLHIQRLTRELIPHMRREEKYLFPYIESFESEVGPDETIVVPLFGTVAYPLQSIHHDHAEDLALLAEIREMTRDYVPPQSACERTRSLYRLLDAFHRELLEHIRIENDILFPRAIEAERLAGEHAKRS